MNKLLLLFLVCFSISIHLSAQVFTSIDVNAGAVSSNPLGLTPYDGKMYFVATTAAQGLELWVSDGTPSGTHIVKDILAGPGDSGPRYLTVAGNKLFFSATDSIHGNELWMTDGTPAGTVMVSDINPGAGSSSPSYMTALAGKVYFSAYEPTDGPELWVSDGTSTNTTLVKDIQPGSVGSIPTGYQTRPGGSQYSAFNEYNGKLYFRADDGTHGVELWSTDGTTNGTTMIELLPGPGSSNPYLMTPFNGKMYFGASDSIHGSELWVSDGTASGTSLLLDINPGTASSSSGSNGGFIPHGNKLYFKARQSATGYELWSTDGTTTGTAIVKDILAGPGSSDAGVDGLIEYNGLLYFGANDSINGTQLWVSDGTSANTSMLKILSSTPYDADPQGFVVYNNLLYFTADIGSATNYQLWVTDGTTTGTTMLAPPIAPNNDPLAATTSRNMMAVANGDLFMNADFNSIGTELWVYTTPNTAITETEGDRAISAYPNPFDRTLTLSGLQSNEHYAIEISDMMGRVCYSSMISQASESTNINMPALPAGVYLMHLAGQSSSQTFRLVRK